MGRRHETPEERRERERLEWLETSDDPQAARWRKYRGMDPDEMLLAIAAKHTEEGRGYCWTTDAEGDAIYPLHRRRLVQQSHSQGFVVHLTDRGRRRVVELMAERGMEQVRCTRCGHGEYEHKGNYPSLGVCDEKPWDHFYECTACECSYFRGPL
jgi:hypothetical protein